MVCHQNNNKVAYRLIVHIFWNVFKHTYRPVIGLITFVLLWTGVTLACFKSSGNTSLWCHNTWDVIILTGFNNNQIADYIFYISTAGVFEIQYGIEISYFTEILSKNGWN